VELLALTGCANGGEAGATFHVGGDDALVEAGAEATTDLDATSPETGDAPIDVTVAATDAGDAADGADSAPPTDASVVDASGVDASGDVAVLSPAPIGQWTFDEGTGSSSADLSGHGHPAALVGGASWTAAGKQGAGLALDGVSGYADVGVPLVETAASFTVMSWARLTVVGSWQVVLSEDDVNGSLFGLKLRGDGSDQFDFDVERSDVMSPAFVVAQSTSTGQASVWLHLAGVYDASGSGAVKVYVNGALEANAAVGQPLVAATGHFLIGRGLYNGVAGSFVDGTLDDVAVYDVALSDAQVATIYDAQR